MAIILVVALGINFSTVGAISFTIGEVTISLSGLAVGSLAGIILNAIIPGNDYKFATDEDLGMSEVKKDINYKKKNKK
jgi:uracil permease